MSTHFKNWLSSNHSGNRNKYLYNLESICKCAIHSSVLVQNKHMSADRRRNGGIVPRIETDALLEVDYFCFTYLQWIVPISNFTSTSRYVSAKDTNDVVTPSTF